MFLSQFSSRGNITVFRSTFCNLSRSKVTCSLMSVKYLGAESCILLSMPLKGSLLCIFLKPYYKLDPHFVEMLLFPLVKRETGIENGSEADRHVAETVVNCALGYFLPSVFTTAQPPSKTRLFV